MARESPPLEAPAPSVWAVVATTAIGGVLYAILAFLIQPPPIPSLTGLIGGLAGFWMARRRRKLTAGLGVAAGVLIGAALHAYSHYAENRLDPEGGLLAHVSLDAALGFAMAAAVLAVAVAVCSWLQVRRQMHNE